MKMEKVKIKPSLLSVLNKLNEKGNSLLVETIKNDEWISDNIESIYLDDNLYLVDMGESEGDMKIVVKIDSFKTLLKYLSFLERLDKISKKYVDNEENKKEIYESFSDIDIEFIEDTEEFLESDEVGIY
jgi:hypothetical protein